MQTMHLHLQLSRRPSVPERVLSVAVANAADADERGYSIAVRNDAVNYYWTN